MNVLENIKDILACPKCGATPDQGLDVDHYQCSNCQTTFFDLQGLPCLFMAGEQQKQLWNDLFAKFLQEKDNMAQANEYALSQSGLDPLSFQRLQTIAAVQTASHEALENILLSSGLTPKRDNRFEQFSAKGFVQYYELMLRDWSWQALPESTDNYRRYFDENEIALEQILSVLGEQSLLGKRVLVLGAGAGRLSWDLNRTLQPKCCVALDFNPMLSFVAHHIIKQEGEIKLAESRRFPRADLPQPHVWTLSLEQTACDQTADSEAGKSSAQSSWIGLCADAWKAPFQNESFDLIVTPWFLDINGRDAKDLIALVDRLLVKEGTWLNYGPLLYPDDLPFHKQYTFEELRELARRSGLALQQEDFFTVPYTYSPLNERGRIEDVWCAKFSKQGAAPAEPLQAFKKCTHDHPPSWYVLPHLPVPAIPPVWVPEDLHNILALFDGQRCLQDVANILAQSISQEHDPLEFAYSFIEEFVFEAE